MAVKSMTKLAHSSSSATNSTILGSLKEFFGVLSKKDSDELEAVIIDGRIKQKALQKQRNKRLERLTTSPG